CDFMFAAEYKYYNANPYDLFYPLPFNKLLSNGCAIGPGTLDPAWDPTWKWWDWPATPFYQHSWTGTNVPCVTPWSQANDGRLVPFPPDAATQLQVTTTNDRIQQEIVAMRPYGPTPLAGLFDDARVFLTKDASDDLGTPAPHLKFGPYNDQYIKYGYRKIFI